MSTLGDASTGLRRAGQQQSTVQTDGGPSPGESGDRQAGGAKTTDASINGASQTGAGATDAANDSTTAYLVGQIQGQGGPILYGGTEGASPHGITSGTGLSNSSNHQSKGTALEEPAELPARQARYYHFPSSLEGLPRLADQITSGAETDLDAAMRMVTFLRSQGRYDASTPHLLESSQQLDNLLREEDPDTDVDLTMATVMLARAAGLPARLAVGYLPGERWAEIYVGETGWVPLQKTSAPTFDSTTGGEAGRTPPLKYLFEASIGDELLRGAIGAPSKLSSRFKETLGLPAGEALSVVAAGAIAAALGWAAMRLMSRRREAGDKRGPYAHLNGEGRREMLHLYRRMESMLGKKGPGPREPGQTVREYAGMSAQYGHGMEEHLAWFTEAAWEAAYNPKWKPDDTFTKKLNEARHRLSSLKESLS